VAAVGFQKWRTLLFAHWEVPPSELTPLLPDGLVPDLFEGRAYVGLVPFTLRGVVMRFHEVNVRTYVRRRDGLIDGPPAVWFFSLDAASSLAVAGARTLLGLPYQRARITLQRDGDRVAYAAERLWPGPTPARLACSWRVGAELGAARAGTMEHFFAERYLLYTRHPTGRLLHMRVDHPPYPLRAAAFEALDEETLIDAAGLGRRGDPVSVLYSEGVDVRLLAPRQVAFS